MQPFPVVAQQLAQCIRARQRDANTEATRLIVAERGVGRVDQVVGVTVFHARSIPICADGLLYVAAIASTFTILPTEYLARNKQIDGLYRACK